jgi:RNA polymerase sigma-70 factor, ECF subfamily
LDSSFLRALRGGDAEAFTAFVRAYAPRVRRLAMHHFRSPFEQEDAVQEVFLLLHRQKTAIDPLRPDDVPGFVLTLARRRIYDLLRSKGREPAKEELSDEAWVSDGSAPFEQAANTELAELLARFEEKLSPKHRDYFRKVFVEGKDFDEARDLLGLKALRARYLKAVLLEKLRHHGPLLEYLGKRDGNPNRERS